MKYSIDDFKKSFASIISDSDEVVYVTSGIWSLGKCFDAPIREIPNLLIKAIQDVITPERTLIFPVYNWSFCSDGIFDLQNTKSQTGALSETFRLMPEVKRTKNPLYSHCVTGPKADDLLNLKISSVWGDGSEFEWYEKNNIRIVRIGIEWKQLAFVHRIEEKGEVPYRYFKTFSGELIDDGVKAPVSCQMFVRYLEVEVENSFAPLFDKLDDLKLIKKSPIDCFRMESLAACDIIDTGMKLLQDDKYTFVPNKHIVKEWVKENIEEVSE